MQKTGARRVVMHKTVNNLRLQQQANNEWLRRQQSKTNVSGGNRETCATETNKRRFGIIVYYIVETKYEERRFHTVPFVGLCAYAFV